MAAHKLLACQVSEMRRLYEHEKWRDVDLAEWFNVSEANVRYHTRDIRRPSNRKAHPRPIQLAAFENWRLRQADVDPASPLFLRLPRYRQAQLYASRGWTVEDMMDEFGVSRHTIRKWKNPEIYDRHRARNTAYKQRGV